MAKPDFKALLSGLSKLNGHVTEEFLENLWNMAVAETRSKTLVKWNESCYQTGYDAAKKEFACDCRNQKPQQERK